MENKKETQSEISMENIEKIMEDYELHSIHEKFILRIITLIIAGLGLIAVLAWDEALRDVAHLIFGEALSVGEKFIYAIVLTIIATFVGAILSKKFLKNTKTKSR